MSDSLDPLEIRIQQLERRIQRQQRFGAVVVIAASLLAFAAFQAPTGKKRFTELDVERLNVVEPDGQLVLAMANKARLPDPLIAGKTFETSRSGPGLIFFDGRGWEVGGLIYGTRPTSNGYHAGAHFSFDQFRNDQVVYLNYEDNGSTVKSAGLYVVDRARTPTLDELMQMKDKLANAAGAARVALEDELRNTSAQRIFVGSENETAMVRLRDRAGRDRIRLMVDSQGISRLEFLDASGKVVDTLPK
jgi:hypothetical protein